MNYEKAYKEALERAKKELSACGSQDCDAARQIFRFFPELKEGEDERIRKLTIHHLDRAYQNCEFDEYKNEIEKCIAWLEKQGKPIDKEKVLIGARKDVALSIMNFLDKNTLGMCLSNMECADLECAVIDSDWSKVYNYMQKKLEKQGEKQKKVSIWKHWKDGIAGNGDGRQIYLTKIGNIYSISSCLGCECDYIELSELDELMREEKQGEPKWSEEDEGMLAHCIGAIHIAGNVVSNSYTFKDKEEMKKWLKSIKQRMEG